jgi:hypothetical protein
MSCLFGKNREIFFPKLDQDTDLLTFSEIAVRYLHQLGYEPDVCASEDEARAKARSMNGRKWPCYFFESDTTGEKPFEEFYVEGQDIDWGRYPNIGVIANPAFEDRASLERFLSAIAKQRASGSWSKESLVMLFKQTVPEFAHFETGKSLDERM